MKDFYRLWMTIWMLGAASFPELCSAASTKAQTEFVRAMDRAMGQKKKKELFHSRLRQLAVPAESHPAYMKSQGLKTKGRRKLDEEYEFVALDLSQYAMKYIGCSNIRTWSDDHAAEDDNDTVLKMDKFVVLRLCPRDSCSNYNEYGCLEQFGDYLVPMEAYLQIMAETYFAQYEEYCETCYECMTGQGNKNNNDANAYYNYYDGDYQNAYENYYNNNNNYAYYGGGNYNRYNGNYNNGGRRLNDDAYAVDDAAAANDDAAAAVDDAYAVAGDDAAVAGDDDAVDDAGAAVDDFYENQDNNDDGNQNEFNAAEDCEYYSVCANYKSACNEYSNLGFDVEDYFECGAFNIGNTAGYLGPHCASDGKTISLGIYSDEDCNDYTSDISQIASYLSIDENELESYYTDNCISCLASDEYELDAEENDDGSGTISEFCDALYEESAKCNRYMGNDGKYAHANQESQEGTVCNFIENLIKKSYDEYGEIVLQEIWWKTYIPDMESMNAVTPKQKWALSVSLLSCIAMFSYASYLYRKIKVKRGAWFPRGKKGYSTYPGAPSTPIDSRLHSGIIQGRSHSSLFEMKNGGTLS